jgi:ankyrin repeat protein
MATLNRRSFLASSFAASAVLGSSAISLGQDSSSAGRGKNPGASAPEIKRPPALDAALVRSFVSAGHSDLPKITDLLAKEAQLINASFDLGGGDWETALGAASHVGNRTIALHLLEQRARPDAFCAAMLGERDFIVSLMRFSPHSANARGPHGYTLMYHLGYSGNVTMAAAVHSHLKSTRDLNQAVLSATASGRTEFVAWLLQHGADNVNMKSFGKTPLDLATEKGHGDIMKLLRDAGGVSGRTIAAEAK